MEGRRKTIINTRRRKHCGPERIEVANFYWWYPINQSPSKRKHFVDTAHWIERPPRLINSVIQGSIMTLGLLIEDPRNEPRPRFVFESTWIGLRKVKLILLTRAGNEADWKVDGNSDQNWDLLLEPDLNEEVGKREKNYEFEMKYIKAILGGSCSVTCARNYFH